METGKAYVTSTISNGKIGHPLSNSLTFDDHRYTVDDSRRRERIHKRWMIIVVAFILVFLLCAIVAVIVTVVYMEKDNDSSGNTLGATLCHSGKCRTDEETSKHRDGAQTPKYPLSFHEFERYVLPNKIREFFYFSKPVANEHLRRLVVTWTDMGDGTYQNTFIAREPTYNICINQTATPLGTPITLTPVGNGKASFRFMNFDGTPNIFIGHIFSACPDKYFFNWFCPEKNVNRHGYCTHDALMDLVFLAEVPDHLPWHTIVTDLYRNTGLYMDDQRWTLTFRGASCEVI